MPTRQRAPFFEEAALTCYSTSLLTAMTPTPLAPIQPTKLNSLQISLLRLFERGMSDEDTLELRRVIVAHLSKKMLAEVERIDNERGYTAEDYERMLNAPS